MRSISAVLFAMVALFACRVEAQDVPSVEVLRAKIAAAAGTALPSSRELLHVGGSGGTIGIEILRSGDDFRQTNGSGPLQTASGSYQGQAWYQNANGQVVLDQPDPGDAAKDTVTTRVTRISAPLNAYVIASLNHAGYGTKEYVDPVTSRIVRRDAIAATGTTITTYDDFQTVDGYTTAWHWITDDGRPEDRSESRIVGLTAVALDKTQIDIPNPRRALVEFPAGKTSVELPVQFYNNTFYVRVNINGRGLDFVLDTGAGGIAINDQVAKQLGLSEVAHGTNEFNAGRFTQATVVVPEMDIGELRMHNVAVSTIPGLPQEEGNISVAGLLGFDFIAELMLRLDYERGHVTAYENGSIPLPHQGQSVSLDIRLGDAIPMTTVAINGSPGERFILDTGNQGGLLIFDYFARRNPGAMVDLGRGDENERSRTVAYGVGGVIAQKPYQLQKVQLGNVTFANYFGYLVTQRTQYSGPADGLIGVSFLRNFTVWVDYVDSEFLLVLNANGAQRLQ